MSADAATAPASSVYIAIACALTLVSVLLLSETYQRQLHDGRRR